MPTVRMLGTHGVPAAYGGFETAAENIAHFLVKKGWRVVVYCQGAGTGPITQDTWRGIERVHIPVHLDGWLGTSLFDFRSIRHACAYRDVCLTFGYNTGIFNIAQRVLGIKNVINMDGIEWSRARWGFFKQSILYVNERFAALFGNHLIADHPDIYKYLLTRAPARKIQTITYGADAVQDVPIEPLQEWGLTAGGYLVLIARSIPENSILEIVKGFSSKPRGKQLVVLGKYEETDPYHCAVIAAASEEVLFPGSIYEPAKVAALRFHALAYLHGHTVGGTNPSLVEALAAGNPVIAHDNPFNRWVARDAALYFSDDRSFSVAVDKLIENRALALSMGNAARNRHQEEFTWEHVAGQYEDLLKKYV